MTKIAAIVSALRRRAALARFRREEQGTIAFLILFMFIIMLMFGGIAVDVMRFEARRVALQQTMDRAALASASLKQTLTPTVVFNDYFAKAGLGSDLDMVSYSAPAVTVTTTAGVSSRTVRAVASVRSYNFFMHMLNVDYLESATTTQAEQGVSQVEIILVLDVSGSMRYDGKIAALRTAAADFVNIVKQNDTLNQVSVGIVPYNAQVNLGQQLRQQYNASFLPTGAGVSGGNFTGVNCLELPSSGYTTTAVSRTTPIPMAAHADVESPSTSLTYIAWSHIDSAPRNIQDMRICNPRLTSSGLVLLPTKNTASVLASISALTEGGRTAIMLGMRWGTALLDESAAPIYAAISDGTVPNRPAANSDPLTRKIIVLMTDGEHVNTPRVTDAYKVGLSPIFRSTNDGNYSIRFTSGRPACAGTGNEFWVPHRSLPTPSGNTNPALAQPCGGGWQATAWTDNSVPAIQQHWEQIWTVVRVTWVARQLYARSAVLGTSYNTMVGAMLQGQFTGVTQMNSILSTICTTAKSTSIEVYGIAFSAPPPAQVVINDCASAPKSNYYYNATSNAALVAAFQQIASRVSELRLTQ